MLDGAPAPLQKGGTVPLISAHVRCGQTAGWIKMPYGGRPPPRRHCVRLGPSSPTKGGTSSIFVPCLLWPNGWIDQDAIWYGGKPRPRPQLQDPPHGKGHSSPPLIGPCLLWPNGRPSQQLLISYLCDHL